MEEKKDRLADGSLVGLMLAASVDDEQVGSHPISCDSRLIPGQAERELAEVKSQAKMIFRRLSRNSAPEASIESGQYSLQ